MITHRRLLSCVLSSLAAVGIGGSCLAQDEPEGIDRRIDPPTGRDLAHWPPSPQFDYRHMRLAIDIPDIQQARFSALETLKVTAVGNRRPTMRLDAGPGIDIKRVLRNGAVTPFRRESEQLWIDFSPAIQPGSDADITIEYECDFSKNHGNGLTWSKGRPDAPGLTEQFPQIHSQGESEENHLWFPCHDFPNVKLTTELVVTVEDGYEVCSNGHLVERKADSPSAGRVTWHWLQDKPHCNYLVTLVIGKFAVIDIGGPQTGRPGLPMHVYTPFGTEETVRERFRRTPDMVAYFEAKLDEPYPWDKYDQLICRDFIWGGMENTSATTLYMQAARGRGAGGGVEDTVSHELAHQWFGDLITCKSWEHLWLNEGWASICEALWNEQKANLAAAGRPLPETPRQRPPAPAAPPPAETSPKPAEPAVDLIKPGEGGADLTPAADGPTPVIAPASDAGRRAYQRTILTFMRTQRGSNHGYAPLYPSLVSNRYDNAEDAIQKTDDVYSKGAMLLHMLRMGLGDEVFTQGTRLYLDRFKFRCAETDDFRHCMEEASGQSLERFFDQWAYRPGLPRFEIDLEYDDATGGLAVTVDQTQRIDWRNPVYEVRLPLLLKYEDGTSEYVYVGVDSRHVRTTFKTGLRPKDVSVDPNLTVLGASSIRKPLAMWINELREGPTLFSRVRAAERLASLDASCPEVTALLLNTAADPDEDVTVREAAANSCNLRTVSAAFTHARRAALAWSSRSHTLDPRLALGR